MTNIYSTDHIDSMLKRWEREGIPGIMAGQDKTNLLLVSRDAQLLRTAIDMAKTQRSNGLHILPTAEIILLNLVGQLGLGDEFISLNEELLEVLDND